MGIFKKTKKLTAQTDGIINGVSAVCVNKKHLPLAEYEVDGVKYKIRVPFDIAAEMERRSEEHSQFATTYVNFGTNIIGQVTKLQGCRVKVIYDPTNPKKARVIG